MAQLMHQAHIRNKLKKILREADEMAFTGSTLSEASLHIVEELQSLIMRLDNELAEDIKSKAVADIT